MRFRRALLLAASTATVCYGAGTVTWTPACGCEEAWELLKEDLKLREAHTADAVTPQMVAAAFRQRFNKQPVTLKSIEAISPYLANECNLLKDSSLQCRYWLWKSNQGARRGIVVTFAVPKGSKEQVISADYVVKER